MAPFPHCDQNVLHAPGTCSICDMFPKLQKERSESNTNFTGGRDPNKKKCPAEERRELGIINRWYGNTPKPPKVTPSVVYKGSTEIQ